MVIKFYRIEGFVKELEKEKNNRNIKHEKKQEKYDHLTMIDFERIAYNKMYGTKWSYGEYTYLKREKKLLPIPTVQF